MSHGSVFLTAAAVLGIAFTHTPNPPLKTDEKCHQKAELGFANVTSKILTKSIWPMVCALNVSAVKKLK